MKIYLALEEGGKWWHVDIHNTDNLKLILNTGHWHKTKIFALMLESPVNMIYDFSLRAWR